MKGVRAIQPLPMEPGNLYEAAIALWSIGVGWQESGDYFTKTHPDIKWIYALWNRSYSRDVRGHRLNGSKIRCFRQNQENTS